MQPFQAQRQLLQQIPGVDALIAATIIAEIGIDMSVFGNAMRLAAWAGVCPGNHQSAGKRKSGVTRRGNVHLKTALVTAAVCASRQKGSYYKDKYHRLRARHRRQERGGTGARGHAARPHGRLAAQAVADRRPSCPGWPLWCRADDFQSAGEAATWPDRAGAGAGTPTAPEGNRPSVVLDAIDGKPAVVFTQDYFHGSDQCRTRHLHTLVHGPSCEHGRSGRQSNRPGRLRQRQRCRGDQHAAELVGPERTEQSQ